MPEEPKDDPVIAKIKYVKYAVQELGFPLITCLFLGFLVWKKMDQVVFKIDRVIKNTRAIMQKLEIPVVIGSDNWEEK